MTNERTHQPIFVQLCEIHTAERSARSKAGQDDRRKRGEERRKEAETSTCSLIFPSAMVCCDAGHTYEPGHRSSGQSVALLVFSFDYRRSACRARCRVTSEQEQLLGPRRAALGGSKAGAAPGKDGTTPQRPFHPCRIWLWPILASSTLANSPLHFGQLFLAKSGWRRTTSPGPPPLSPGALPTLAKRSLPSLAKLRFQGRGGGEEGGRRVRGPGGPDRVGPGGGSR